MQRFLKAEDNPGSDDTECREAEKGRKWLEDMTYARLYDEDLLRGEDAQS